MEKKIKIFFGPAMSGKTKAAREYAEGKKTVFIFGEKLRNEYDLKFVFSPLEKDTELLIIDDVKLSFLNNNIYSFFPDKVLVDKKGESPFVIDCPEIIFTICCDHIPISDTETITRRCEFIKFSENQPV